MVNVRGVAPLPRVLRLAVLKQAAEHSYCQNTSHMILACDINLNSKRCTTAAYSTASSVSHLQQQQALRLCCATHATPSAPHVSELKDAVKENLVLHQTPGVDSAPPTTVPQQIRFEHGAGAAGDTGAEDQDRGRHSATTTGLQPQSSLHSGVPWGVAHVPHPLFTSNL